MFSEYQQIDEAIHTLLRAYRRTLTGDHRHLLEGFRYVHAARKVVGVGSVGTRAWIVLLLGHDDSDPLFLQAKEAQGSVLEPFLGKSRYRNHGQRVVEGQRLMQSASDIMLGWMRTDGVDGVSRDFYIRQLWDGKGSAIVEAMNPAALTAYAGLCGWTLARAHARSGDAAAIASYLGTGAAFRPCHGKLCRNLRRPERAGLRGTQTSRRLREGRFRERVTRHHSASEQTDLDHTDRVNRQDTFLHLTHLA